MRERRGASAALPWVSGRVLVPGRFRGSFQGQSRPGRLPGVGRAGGRPGRPGSRRPLTRWAARRWRLSSCRARPPPGRRAGPRPRPRSRSHRASSGLHLGRADTVIAPMHAAVPLPPRRQGHGGAMCRPCAADKLRGV